MARNPKDTRSLGPSDSSDSGSDMAHNVGRDLGDSDLDAGSDRHGTGEHLTAGKEPRMHVNEDRDTDRVVGPEEAGLGDGLDQAEEARVNPENSRKKKEK
jgi:hypothetical protein